MKTPKKKKIEDDADLDDNRPVPFEALAELTSSEVIQQVKSGMSRLEPLENEDEFREDAA